MKNDCPLCSIPSRESLLYENKLVYIASTKESKGHKVRVMVATKRHTDNASFQEGIMACAVLIDYMTRLMKGQDWFIVDSTHATIPEHWHMVACDTPMDDVDDPLFTQTPKVHFPYENEKILIGIPAHNEAQTIRSIVEKALNYGKVIVVDDGSTDDTKMVSVHGGAYVLPHERNLGYGSSIIDLFHIANQGNYDVLITLDADGQHDPSEIPRFLRELEHADVVIGNRFKGDSKTPRYRKFGVKAISKLSGLGDAQCGFRAYSRNAIVTIDKNLYETGMGVSVEILKIAQKEKLKINEVPCTIHYGEELHSQNPVSHGLEVIRALFWSIIWDKPSKTLLPMGLLFLISAIVAGAQTVNLYVQFHVIVLSWALLTVGSLMFALLIFNTLTFVLVFKNKKEGKQ